MRVEPWIELALLIAAAVPGLPVLGKSAARRGACEHPVVTILLAGLACAAIAVLFSTVERTPSVLRLSTAVAVATAVLAYVRARPDYGTRRGLPPGSLGLARSLDAISNQTFYTQAARRWGPIFKTSQFHQPVVCIVDLERGFDFLRSAAPSLSQVPRPWAGVIPGGYVEFMDGQHHERYREILRRGLSGAVVAGCKDSIAAIIRRELSTVASTSSTVLDASLNRMTSTSLLRVFFGLAPDSREAEIFQRYFAAIDRRLDFRFRVPRRLEADVASLTDAVRGLTAERLEEPSVLSELVRTSPEVLADSTVVRNLLFMVQNARKSLAGMLRWLAKLSCDHPRWTPDLRREHDTGGDMMATRFTNELFRLWQSEYVYRRTLRECRIGEFRIPKGWMVRVCVREAHAHADFFPDPAAFDPGRFAERSYSKKEYAPFSDGPHACFGAGLAYTVAKIFLHELAAGFHARTISDGPVERENNHWAHWRPSARFRIALISR